MNTCIFLLEGIDFNALTSLLPSNLNPDDIYNTIFEKLQLKEGQKLDQINSDCQFI